MRPDHAGCIDTKIGKVLRQKLRTATFAPIRDKLRRAATIERFLNRHEGGGMAEQERRVIIVVGEIIPPECRINAVVG